VKVRRLEEGEMKMVAGERKEKNVAMVRMEGSEVGNMQAKGRGDEHNCLETERKKKGMEEKQGKKSDKSKTTCAEGG
jgi:hypothetical protein